MCEDTHMTAPATVKLLAVFFYWVTPENAVGMAAGRQNEREITEKQRLQEREWARREARRRRSERRKTSRRGRGRSGSRLMWKCLWSPRASPPPPRSLYLFQPFFHSHWHSSLGASLHCDVLFRSAITAEMRQSGPTRVCARVHGSSAS